MTSLCRWLQSLCSRATRAVAVWFTGEWKVQSAVGAGANTLVLEGTAALPPQGTYVVIDPYTPQCECRKITSLKGATIGFHPLQHEHAAGVSVLHWRSLTIPMNMYGAVGNASANDTRGVQAALTDQWLRGATIGIDGQFGTYLVAEPMIGGPGARLSHATIKANAAYAPCEETNALFMNAQGRVLTFAVDVLTDLFTTAEPHLIPSDESRVVLKGMTGCEGIVPGRTYYTRDRTECGFRLCEVPGGPALVVLGSSDGTGTVYCEVRGAQRVYFDDVTFDGCNLPGMNGMDVALQQPSECYKLRVNNCPGDGIRVRGQDGLFINTMVNNCQRGLVLDGSMFKFYVYNAEKCWIGIELTSAATCLFSGLHFELNSGAGCSDEYSVCIQVHRAINLLIDSVHASLTKATQTVFRSTGLASQVGYTLRGVSVPSSVDIIMIDDAARGENRTVWTDSRKFLDYFHAPLDPTSSSYPDTGGMWNIVGVDGRFVRAGMMDHTLPCMIMQAARNQTGNILEFNDTTAARAAYVDKNGAMASLYVRFGEGEPESVGAPVGAVYHRTKGGPPNFYVMEGAGWMAK